ncbi:glycine-rich cell wall structural protein 2 [Beta vulgaris subsp. vulgaris]|uniref:glycine-rich cell wall structural protein 2 n=1 Tax=Beta vulgaris subsp. vulgaris TaxID=3555 RepID=UPI0020370D38|nr:glycine-rich cell wall structural protein 2 [Beta vulgaris subsp. vulgaris]
MILFRISINPLTRAVVFGLILSVFFVFTCSSSSSKPSSKPTTPPGMANHQGNDNSGSGGPNTRWGHEAAPDGSWEYSWRTSSVPGGSSFAYGSASARSSGSGGGSSSGFGFSSGSGGAGAGSGSGGAGAGSGSGSRGVGAGSGQGRARDRDLLQNQHMFGQPHMHMPPYGAGFYYDMPFPAFPMGPMFGPYGTDDNGGRGRGGGSAGASR